MRKKKDLSNINTLVTKLSAPSRDLNSTIKQIISNIPQIVPTFLYSIHLVHNVSDSHSSLPFWATAISSVLLVGLILLSCVLSLQAGPGTTWGAGAAASWSLADVQSTMNVYLQVFPISCSNPALSPCCVCADHENHPDSSWKCWSNAQPIPSNPPEQSQDSSFIPCNPVNLCALPQPQHIMGSDLSASLEK